MGALDDARNALMLIKDAATAMPPGPTAETLVGDSHIVEHLAQINQALAYVRQIGGPAEEAIGGHLIASQDALNAARGKLVSAADDMLVAHQHSEEAARQAEIMAGRLQ